MHHRLNLSSLAVFLTLATSAIASAQGPASHPPRADSDDVSEINGTPVPVGDHNRYRYSYKRWNLSVSPFGPIVESYSGAVSYAFHPHLAVGSS